MSPRLVWAAEQIRRSSLAVDGEDRNWAAIQRRLARRDAIRFWTPIVLAFVVSAIATYEAL